MIITNEASTIKFDLGNGEEYHFDKDNLYVKKRLGFVSVYSTIDSQKKEHKIKFKYTDVSSPVFASNTELAAALVGYKVNTGVTVGNVLLTDDEGKIMTLEPNGSVPVTLQDQTTPVIIVPLSRLEQQTTSNGAVAIDDYTITLTSVTGVSAGKLLTIFDPASIRFAYFFVVGAPVGNVVTIDSPMPFAFPSGSYVDIGDINMAVDGSVTPVVFGVRNNAGAVPPPGIDLSMDVTRVMTSGLCDTAVSLNKFGDLPRLTNGICLRKRDGEIYNIYNVKDNEGIAGIAFDFNVYASTNPAQGIDGFQSRLTFAGQNKMGVTVRLAINEDLELIVQDDLTDLITLKMVAEGSLVQL